MPFKYILYNTDLTVNAHLKNEKKGGWVGVGVSRTTHNFKEKNKYEGKG